MTNSEINDDKSYSELKSQQQTINHLLAFLYQESWSGIEQNIDNGNFDFDLTIPFQFMPMEIKSQLFYFLDNKQYDLDFIESENAFFIEFPLLLLLFNNIELYQQLEQKTGYNFSDYFNEKNNSKQSKLNSSESKRLDLIKTLLFNIALFYDNIDIIKQINILFYSDNNNNFNKKLVHHINTTIQKNPYICELDQYLKQLVLDKNIFVNNLSVYPSNCFNYAIDHCNLPAILLSKQVLLYPLVYDDKDGFEKLAKSIINKNINKNGTNKNSTILIDIMEDLPQTSHHYMETALAIFIKLFAWIQGHGNLYQKLESELYNQLFSKTNFNNDNMVFWYNILSISSMFDNIQQHFNNNPLKINIEQDYNTQKSNMYCLSLNYSLTINKPDLIDQFKTINFEHEQFNKDNFKLLLTIKANDDSFFKNIVSKTNLCSKLEQLFKTDDLLESNNVEYNTALWAFLFEDQVVQNYFENKPIQLKQDDWLPKKYELLEQININMIDHQYLLNSILTRQNIDSSFKINHHTNDGLKNYQKQIKDELKIIHLISKNNKDLLVQYEQQYNLISQLDQIIQYAFDLNQRSNAMLSCSIDLFNNLLQTTYD